MEIIEKHPDKPWDWGVLSKNPKLNIDIIINNLNKSWDWSWTSISENNMEKGKELWIKKKVKEAIIKKHVSYKVLCNKR